MKQAKIPSTILFIKQPAAVQNPGDPSCSADLRAAKSIRMRTRRCIGNAVRMFPSQPLDSLRLHLRTTVSARDWQIKRAEASGARETFDTFCRSAGYRHAP